MSKELIKSIKELIVESYKDADQDLELSTKAALVERAEIINETGAINWPNHFKTGGQEFYLEAAAEELYLEYKIKKIAKKYTELIAAAAGDINKQIILYKMQADEILNFTDIIS
jgi:hypothetical protein